VKYNQLGQSTNNLLSQQATNTHIIHNTCGKDRNDIKQGI